MTLTVDFWHLVGLLLGFMSFCFAAGRLLMSQFNKQLDTRFVSMETHYQVQEKQLAQVIKQYQEDSKAQIALERQFLQLKADLPLHYVRREDFVRNQTLIEAKLDAVALKIENLQLGVNNAR